MDETIGGNRPPGPGEAYWKERDRSIQNLKDPPRQHWPNQAAQPPHPQEEHTVSAMLGFQQKLLADLLSNISHLESRLALVLYPRAEQEEQKDKRLTDESPLLVDLLDKHNTVLSIASSRVQQLFQRVQL